MGTSHCYEGETTIALCEGHVLGVGNAENFPVFHNGKKVHLHNAFSHPRLIISECQFAEMTFHYFMHQILPYRCLRRPTVIVHLCHPYEGGIAPVEYHILAECWYNVGAKEIYISTEQREYCEQELQCPKHHFQQYSPGTFSSVAPSVENKPWWSLR